VKCVFNSIYQQRSILKDDETLMIINDLLKRARLDDFCRDLTVGIVTEGIVIEGIVTVGILTVGYVTNTMVTTKRGISILKN